MSPTRTAGYRKDTSELPKTFNHYNTKGEAKREITGGWCSLASDRSSRIVSTM